MGNTCFSHFTGPTGDSNFKSKVLNPIEDQVVHWRGRSRLTIKVALQKSDRQAERHPGCSWTGERHIGICMIQPYISGATRYGHPSNHQPTTNVELDDIVHSPFSLVALLYLSNSFIIQP